MQSDHYLSQSAYSEPPGDHGIIFIIQGLHIKKINQFSELEFVTLIISIFIFWGSQLTTQ